MISEKITLSDPNSDCSLSISRIIWNSGNSLMILIQVTIRRSMKKNLNQHFPPWKLGGSPWKIPRLAFKKPTPMVEEKSCLMNLPIGPFKSPCTFKLHRDQVPQRPKRGHLEARPRLLLNRVLAKRRSSVLWIGRRSTVDCRRPRQTMKRPSENEFGTNSTSMAMHTWVWPKSIKVVEKSWNFPKLPTTRPSLCAPFKRPREFTTLPVKRTLARTTLNDPNFDCSLSTWKVISNSGDSLMKLMLARTKRLIAKSFSPQSQPWKSGEFPWVMSRKPLTKSMPMAVGKSCLMNLPIGPFGNHLQWNSKWTWHPQQ